MMKKAQIKSVDSQKMSPQAVLDDYFNDLLAIENDLSAVDDGNPNKTDESSEADVPGLQSLEAHVSVSGETNQTIHSETEDLVQLKSQSSEKPSVKTPMRQSWLAQINILNSVLAEWENWREKDQHECLLLSVQKIPLSICLDQIGLPKPWPKDTEALNEKEALFSHIYHDGKQVRVVVSLAEMILPGKAKIQNERTILIPIENTPWSLKVDDVKGTVILNSAQTNWNSNSVSRPWLAGMSQSEACALLDVPELIKLLNDKWS